MKGFIPKNCIHPEKNKHMVFNLSTFSKYYFVKKKKKKKKRAQYTTYDN